MYVVCLSGHYEWYVVIMTGISVTPEGGWPMAMVTSPDSPLAPQSSDHLHEKVARHDLAVSSMDTLAQFTSHIN